MENKILEKINRQSGMTVPEGFFADFNKRMAESLPEQVWEREEGQQTVIAAPKRTKWQIVRPYVYMAAMFLGVWLMMHMFSFFRPSNSNMSIDSNPVLTAALENDTFVNEYIMDDIDEESLIDEMWDGGVTPDDLYE